MRNRSGSGADGSAAARRGQPPNRSGSISIEICSARPRQPPVRPVQGGRGVHLAALAAARETHHDALLPGLRDVHHLRGHRPSTAGRSPLERPSAGAVQRGPTPVRVRERGRAPTASRRCRRRPAPARAASRRRAPGRAGTRSSRGTGGLGRAVLLAASTARSKGTGETGGTTIAPASASATSRSPCQSRTLWPRSSSTVTVSSVSSGGGCRSRTVTVWMGTLPARRPAT